MANEVANPLVQGQGIWYELCGVWGHIPTSCLMMWKYQNSFKNMFYDFCKSLGNNIDTFHMLHLMRDHIIDTYKVHEAEGSKVMMSIYNTPIAYNQGRGNGFQGRGWGGFGDLLSKNYNSGTREETL